MNIVAGLAAVIAGAIWLWLCVRILEWRDRHADIARARQHRMNPITWVTTNTIAAIRPAWIWAVFLAGLAVIVYLAWQWSTAATLAAALVLGVNGLRNLSVDPDDITLLRDALGQIIGVDSRQRPPKVTREGNHPAGGPLRLTLAGHPGFQYWEQSKRVKVEDAIEATMPGDWENVEWQGDGTSVWERLPELPDKVAYAGPVDGLDWYELPVGINGAGEVAVADLSQHPHWFVAGSTGFGKTSWLRVAAAHLLHHRVQIAAVDINYAGLAFLEGRPGVVAAMDSYEQIEATIAALRGELRDRLTQLKTDRTYRPPLVIFVDELEVLCDRAKATGKKAGREPQLIADLLEIARTGRKVDMHLILATQRPEGKTIPTSLRDNALGRLAVGPLGQHAAQMVLDQQWARSVNTPKIKGRTVLRCGDWLGWVQGFWLADPDEVKHPQSERNDAARLLPARIVSTPSRIVGGVGFGESARESAASSSSKPGAETIIESDVRPDARVVRVAEPDAAEKARIRNRRYEANLKAALAADPLDPRHGTSLGRRVHCPCKWCRAESRPNLVEVSP